MRYAIDEPNRKGKQRIFECILDTYQLKPMQVLVLGDNSDSEILAGNRLGMRTVQTLRAGVPRADNATFYIYSFSELKELLTSLEV
ncbi:HAD hydrolase-like protein [Nostoc sp.]|uniref:HAD hydrolase-like protein n=1 Tax=Nostoc sp. TaxID=1180 RepID=UPI003FA5CFD5